MATNAHGQPSQSFNVFSRQAEVLDLRSGMDSSKMPPKKTNARQGGHSV